MGVPIPHLRLQLLPSRPLSVKMSSSQDLKDVLKESLENRGALGEIKARIRAEVFSALDDQTEAKPPISNDSVLVFELIREFLEYNNCKYSASVLISETGLPKVPLDREFLRNELNVVEDAPSRSVPLLYSLVSSYRDSNSNRLERDKPHRDGNKKGIEHDGPGAVIVKGGYL